MSLVRGRKQEQTEKNLQILKESMQTSHREAPVNQQEAYSRHISIGRGWLLCANIQRKMQKTILCVRSHRPDCLHFQHSTCSRAQITAGECEIESRGNFTVSL